MSREKGQTHKGSILLSPEENFKIFSLFEPRCLALSTAVVQLYSTEPPTNSHWVKHGAGVLCLIKDGNKRSYFLRLYCTIKDCLIWEHELYIKMDFNRTQPFFMTFEGHVNIVGINFASDDEAQDFYDNAVNYAYRMATRKKRLAHSEEEARQPAYKSSEIQENVYEEIPPVTLRKAEKLSEKSDFNSLFGPDRPRVQRKVGLNKNNIGSPSNFVHVAHIGFDQDRGFDTRGETVIINQFLKKAGVYDAYTSDRETKAFIDEFMQQNDVINELKSEYENDSHETIERRNNNTIKSNKNNKLMGSKTITPRLPLRQGPPMPSIPAPILTSESHKSSKPVPGGGPPPPPPPPPPPSMIDGSTGPPLASPAPSQQRQHIESGQGDSRNALLDSIRKGANLKKINPADVDNRAPINQPADSSSSTKTDILATALSRAITERRQHMEDSENSEEEVHENDDDWQ